MASGVPANGQDCGHMGACPVSFGCAPRQPSPCSHIVRVHAEKLLLCDRLEAIADAIPHRVDRLQCLVVASRLVPLLRESHSYEEEVVFPAFEKAVSKGSAGNASILRLKAEHIYDESSAQDLTAMLLKIGHGAEVENPEALGFMLRAFFDMVRRHIAFEREHVLPLAIHNYA